MSQGREQSGSGCEHAAGARGDKVRETIGKMLSREEQERGGDTPGSIDARENVEDKPADSLTRAAVEEHISEIERRVGELVGDEALEGEGEAREKAARDEAAKKRQ